MSEDIILPAGSTFDASLSKPVDLLAEPPCYPDPASDVVFRTAEDAFTLGHLMRRIMEFQLLLWEEGTGGVKGDREHVEMVSDLQQRFLASWKRHYPEIDAD